MLFPLLCSKAMVFSPFWHLSHSVQPPPPPPQPYLQICVKNSPLQTMPQQSHFKLRLLDGLPVLSTTIFQLKLPCKQQVIVRNWSKRIGHDQAEYVFDDLECRTGNSDYTKIKIKQKNNTTISKWPYNMSKHDGEKIVKKLKERLTKHWW